MPLRLNTILIGLLVLTATVQAQNKRDAKVKEDRQSVSQRRDWIYNDLAAGFREAKRTGRPLMVVFR